MLEIRGCAVLSEARGHSLCTAVSRSATVMTGLVKVTKCSWHELFICGL